MWQPLGNFELISNGNYYYTLKSNKAIDAFRIKHNLILDSRKTELACIVALFAESGKKINIFNPQTFSYRDNSQIFLSSLPKDLIQSLQIGLKRIDRTDLDWNVEIEGFMSASNVYNSQATLSFNIQASTDCIILLAGNPNRLGATIWNKSNNTLFVDFSAEVNGDMFALEIFPGGYYEVPFDYTGFICGRWELNEGTAAIREFII